MPDPVPTPLPDDDRMKESKDHAPDPPAERKKLVWYCPVCGWTIGHTDPAYDPACHAHKPPVPMRRSQSAPNPPGIFPVSPFTKLPVHGPDPPAEHRGGFERVSADEARVLADLAECQEKLTKARSLAAQATPTCPTCGSGEPIVDRIQIKDGRAPIPRKEVAEDWRCLDPFHEPSGV